MTGEPSANKEHMSNKNDATRSQNDMLFSLGNAMSGAPIMSGTIQLPKPPIIAHNRRDPGEHLNPRRHQLSADQDRKQGSDQAANNGEDEIKRPNVLVVGGIEIPPPPSRDVVLVLMMSIDVVMREVGDGRHVSNDSGDA